VALPPLGESQALFTAAFWLRPFSLHEGKGKGLRRMILSSGGGFGEPELYLEDGALIFAVGAAAAASSRDSEPPAPGDDGASLGTGRRQLSHRFAWNPPANGWAYIVVSYGAALPSDEAAENANSGFLDLYVDFHFVESAALPGPAVDLRRLRVGSGGGVGSSGGAAGLGSGQSADLHGMLASLRKRTSSVPLLVI
jgi:hypothetical protein